MKLLLVMLLFACGDARRINTANAGRINLEGEGEESSRDAQHVEIYHAAAVDRERDDPSDEAPNDSDYSMSAKGDSVVIPFQRTNMVAMPSPKMPAIPFARQRVCPEACANGQDYEIHLKVDFPNNSKEYGRKYDGLMDNYDGSNYPVVVDFIRVAHRLSAIEKVAARIPGIKRRSTKSMHQTVARAKFIPGRESQQTVVIRRPPWMTSDDQEAFAIKVVAQSKWFEDTSWFGGCNQSGSDQGHCAIEKDISLKDESKDFSLSPHMSFTMSATDSLSEALCEDIGWRVLCRNCEKCLHAFNNHSETDWYRARNIDPDSLMFQKFEGEYIKPNWLSNVDVSTYKPKRDEMGRYKLELGSEFHTVGCAADDGNTLLGSVAKEVDNAVACYAGVSLLTGMSLSAVLPAPIAYGAGMTVAPMTGLTQALCQLSFWSWRGFRSLLPGTCPWHGKNIPADYDYNAIASGENQSKIHFYDYKRKPALTTYKSMAEKRSNRRGVGKRIMNMKKRRIDHNTKCGPAIIQVIQAGWIVPHPEDGKETWAVTKPTLARGKPSACPPEYTLFLPDERHWVPKEFEKLKRGWQFPK